MSNERKYYVYQLIDPRNGEVFYVGKGCGNRRFQHVRYAKRLADNNKRKQARIIEILNSNLEVKAEIYRSGLTEHEALVIERELIFQIGLERLTNASPGRQDSSEMAKVLLKSIMPFHRWHLKNKPSELEIECYWACVNGLNFLVEKKEAIVVSHG